MGCFGTEKQKILPTVSPTEIPALQAYSTEFAENQGVSTTPLIRPEGFEPPTLGSEDRCAIQLRHGREM